jgi:hypothetical protein
VLDASDGFFGAGGNQSFEVLSQTVKIPQLRNLYDKVSMFGSALVGFLSAPDTGRQAIKCAVSVFSTMAQSTPYFVS